MAVAAVEVRPLTLSSFAGLEPLLFLSSTHAASMQRPTFPVPVQRRLARLWRGIKRVCGNTEPG